MLSDQTATTVKFTQPISYYCYWIHPLPSQTASDKIFSISYISPSNLIFLIMRNLNFSKYFHNCLILKIFNLISFFNPLIAWTIYQDFQLILVFLIWHEKTYKDFSS